MKSLLIIGCGDIALRAIPLLTKHYRVYALVRSSANNGKLRALGVTPISGDLDDRNSLARLAGLADVVLHLAPPPNAGKSSYFSLKRPVPGLSTRGDKGKIEFADPRTRHLLAALSRGTLPQRFIYVGTSGVYGDCGGAVVDETHPLNPQSARAVRRVDAERHIRAWAKRNGIHASTLRVPGIYAADRLPLERIRLGTPAITASEDGYTNHIHADDLARILVAALRHGRPNRVYHACDDSELKMGDYFDVLADAHGLSRPPRISRAEAQRVLPESLLSFLNESRRLGNGRMKRELGVALRYPTVSSILNSATMGQAASTATSRTCPAAASSSP